MKLPETPSLRRLAKELASRPYHMEIIETQLIDGDTFLTARLVEMPHCIVQGNGLAELCSEMESAAYEYILTGLQYGATIPDPYPYTVPTYA